MLKDPLVQDVGDMAHPHSSLPPPPPNGTTTTTKRTPLNNNTVACAVSISTFAVLGTLLRMILTYQFGGYCDNNQCVMKYFTSNILPTYCVTSSTSPIFLALPTNMLGSFIMGMMQSGLMLGLPGAMPVPWAPARSKFQSRDITHLGIRTGFCGSLTTFSSWNTQMVTMLHHDNQEKVGFMSVLFGYIVGLNVALACFTAGQHLSGIIHRFVNPSHAREADALEDMVPIPQHKNLPDFERHYLASIMEADELERMKEESPKLIEEFEKWKVSTERDRFGGKYISTLNDIQDAVLVNKQNPDEELLEVAQKAGWDLIALKNYTIAKDELEKGKEETFTEVATAAGVLFTIIFVLFILDATTSGGDNIAAENYRTLLISGMLAPLGALIRWRLSIYNGNLSGKYSWFPAGTLAANIIASVISILTAIVLHNKNESSSSYLMIAASAVGNGFCGSLSTVSTFVAEIDKLLKSMPRHSWGYSYGIVSIMVCFIVCDIIYSISVTQSDGELE